MEDLTNWCVYMHANRANGKKYIGITSQKPTRRWANGKGYCTQPHFFRAIEKWGWDGFTHEILFTDLTQEEANGIEILLIKKYKTQSQKFGYNLVSGGGGISGLHRSEETRGKIREAVKKNWENNEYKSKMSEAMKKSWKSKDLRNRVSGSNNNGARPVICVDTNQKYGSMVEAANDTGVNNNNIYQVCKGIRKTAGGYRWVYAGG